MTKVEALHEVITALGGTPTATTVAGCIAEITTIKGGAPTAGASTSEAIHELALALTPEPPTPPEPPEPTTYTVTFDLNEGSGTVPDPITVTAGESTALPSGEGLEPPSPKGPFVGWSVTENMEPAVDDPYTPEDDITLYALWTVV